MEDPSKPGQRHPDQNVDDFPDSDDHAEICPPHEMDYIPGDGFFIHDVMREREKEFEERNPRKGGRQRGTYLSERTIIHMHNCIMQQREMTGATAVNEARRAEGDFHEGTDTLRGSKTGIHERSDNHFSLDVSESRIRISGGSSGHMLLNGSQVRHSYFISIELRTPDGRVYGEIAMSYEQFAAALFSNMSQPCTWTRYWSHNEANVMLRERVKEPDSIKDRMKQRLESSLEESDEVMQEVIDKIRDVAEGKSRMGKVAARELLAQAERAHEHRMSNSSFVVEQALEETTSMVEGAGVYAAILNNVDVERLREIGGFDEAAGKKTLELESKPQQEDKS